MHFYNYINPPHAPRPLVPRVPHASVLPSYASVLPSYVSATPHVTTRHDESCVMEWIRTLNFLKTRMKTSADGYEYFESTLKEWKSAINGELNPFMLKHFGVSVKYHGYNDDPALISLRRR